MIRKFLPRLRLFKTFNPIRATPILPLTAQVGLRSPNSVLRTSQPFASRLFTRCSIRLTSSSSSQSPLDDRPTLPPDATLSQRLKHLIKSYGWYALGVYIILTVVDFGVAFAGVNLLGAKQVSRIAVHVKEYVSGFVFTRPVEPGKEEVESVSQDGANQEGLYAMIVLAYMIHKTLFLPIRVGLTAVLTPKLVGWLGRRGWAGGEGTKRAAREMRERMRSPRSRGD